MEVAENFCDSSQRHLSIGRSQRVDLAMPRDAGVPETVGTWLAVLVRSASAPEAEAVLLVRVFLQAVASTETHRALPAGTGLHDALSVVRRAGDADCTHRAVYLAASDVIRMGLEQMQLHCRPDAMWVLA